MSITPEQLALLITKSINRSKLPTRQQELDLWLAVARALAPFLEEGGVELPIREEDVTNLVEDLANKLNKNPPIVPGTHNSITYDANGIVVAGSDIPIPAPDDHLVIVTPTDPQPNTLQNKLQSSTTVTFSETTDVHGAPVMTASVAPITPFYESTPLPDDIGAPGTSPTVSHGDHVHPANDTVGGNLYLIDSTAAVPIFYRASDVIPSLYANPMLVPSIVGVWDLSQQIQIGSNLGGH